MSEGLLVACTVLVIVAFVAVLAIYLFVIGGVVRHLAKTLDEQIFPGAAGILEHVSAVGPAADAIHRTLKRVAALLGK